ncbi:HK97-gp10 family putative phage morphogenesis protein [Acetobacterium wieringae]|nr:HK97-gp10 family putative phage morphogenesis protein [Acetobacterium wieringae]
MAMASFMAGDDFMLKLSRLETDMEMIAKKAIYAGAKVVADAMKINLKGVLSDEATGELVEAMGITPIKLLGGQWTAKIGFDGYDANGVAYQLIARILESGTSTRKKKPFMRKTMNQVKKQVAEVMTQVIDEEMKKIFG